MHPLQEDVTVLKDQELDDKIRDLSKKILMASRFPNQSVLQQIEMMLTTYKQEQSRRSKVEYEKTIAKSKEEVQTDLNELVNVDKR